MKLGMPVLYEFDSVKENVELAKKLNLDFIELNLNFGYCRTFLEKANYDIFFTNNIEATLHFYDEADFASYSEVVNGYLTLLEKYARLGEGFVKMINIHLNEGPIVTISGNKNYMYEKEYEDYLARLLKNLSKAREICKKYHIDMVIENVYIPSFIKRTYYRLFKEGYAFNYDIGHDNYHNNQFQMLLNELDMQIKEMHIHDATKQKCHLALGQGELDIAYYKDIAKEHDSYVVIEVKKASELESSIPLFKSI